ncbi:protein lin-54 homolog isoform X2 [Stegodyphus dumicola]|uniref:protein lin-54 homolog isoform X2 n=1 Tax=Stegodyphus dumicola TaxID=202533 RepID=UPI0015B19B72|nr:protein lin-54 homolog isoform X2 [Stegodyphus dumicola]
MEQITVDLSPKGDMDLNESSLSFISSLSSGKDEDSVILPDTVNVDVNNHIIKGNMMKADSVDCAQDIFSIAFDKTGLNAEQTDSLMNTLSSVESTANLQDFAIVNNSDLTTSVVQTTTSNFITSVPCTKTADLPSAKVNVSNLNKPGATQVLIFQKPPGNLSTMLVGTKSVPVASASNVAIVQTSTGVASGTKILTLPTLNTSGNVINAVNPTSAVKTNDVKILLSQVPGTASSFVTAKPLVSTSNANSGLQGPLKRAVTPSTSGQMFTKVIITNNTSSNQSLVTPVPVSATATTPIAGTQPQSILLASPNKTYTLSRNLVNISSSQQILKAVPGTPPKQYVLSPVKPTQKLAYAPITYSRSPRRIAPATNAAVSTVNSGAKVAAVMCPTTVTSGISGVKMSVPQSPTKVILKPVPQTVLKPLISGSNTNSISGTFTSVASSAVTPIQQTTVPVSSGPAPQTALQVPGSKFHYVRLVSAPTTSTTTTMVKKESTLIPVSSTAAVATNVAVTTAAIHTSASQVRPTVPIAPAKLVAPKQIGPKFLIPTASGSQIRGGNTVTSNQLSQLPAGTLIPVGGGSQSYVMVPAQYVTQLQQPSTGQVTGTQMLNILPAPAAPNSGTQSAYISLSSNPPQNSFQSSNSSSGHAAHHSPRHVNGRAPVENDSRPRKPCNCTKSQCLKLYCDCFANGEFCNNCNCNNCYNNLSHEEERQKAIKACLDRNPLAFHPKIGKSREGDQERRHTKGCNCKRSYCLKNYCECYEAKILCTNLCKCIGCKNFEDSSERKTLMHLADAAEVRVQQQAAAKTNLSSQILDIPTKPPVMSRTGERLPFAFVTDDVLEATCLCLLAHAHDAEKCHASEEEIERLVLQEFGRCLMRIIDCANKTKVSKMDVQ